MNGARVARLVSTSTSGHPDTLPYVRPRPGSARPLLGLLGAHASTAVELTRPLLEEASGVCAEATSGFSQVDVPPVCEPPYDSSKSGRRPNRRASRRVQNAESTAPRTGPELNLRFL